MYSSKYNAHMRLKSVRYTAKYIHAFERTLHNVEQKQLVLKAAQKDQTIIRQSYIIHAKQLSIYTYI